MLFRVTHNRGWKLFNLANVAWIEYEFDQEADQFEQHFLSVQFVGADLFEKFYIDEDTAKRFDEIWQEAK